MADESKNMRTYVVLRETNASSDLVEGGATYVEVGRARATSNEDAALKLATEKQEGGRYVAVPERSFQPLPVEIETTPRARLKREPS